MNLLGLCICYNHNNYGTMLQAYATIKILERKNIGYEIIRCRRKKSLINYIKCIPLIFNPLFYDEIIYRIHGLLKNDPVKKELIFLEKNRERNKIFSKFWKDNFKYLSPEFYGYKELSQYSRKYKACLVGSDQLWKPKGLPENIYDLMFTDDDMIRISYATSFGVSKIPLIMRKRMAKFLKRFDFLSVRENAGKKIIWDLVKIEPEVVLDPTLLFDQNDWDIFFPEEKIYNESYIFAYLLGTNQEHRRLIKSLAFRLELKIVALKHLDQFINKDENFGDFTPFDIGPSEFINLVRHAQFVCTDSFHGSVFSIINHKQFIVFDRFTKNSKVSTNSRIETLCTNLGLNDRRFNNNDKDILTSIKKQIKYDEVDKKLSKLRILSYNYINNALEYMREN